MVDRGGEPQQAEPHHEGGGRAGARHAEAGQAVTEKEHRQVGCAARSGRRASPSAGRRGRRPRRRPWRARSVRRSSTPSGPRWRGRWSGRSAGSSDRGMRHVHEAQGTARQSLGIHRGVSLGVSHVRRPCLPDPLNARRAESVRVRAREAHGVRSGPRIIRTCPRSVAVMPKTFRAGSVTGRHAHRRAQLLYATAG